ncbi:hypothetical protein [Arthrobacter sp. B1805]|uniref:HNH endonuclease n=1 Tax=Arthrobacter sp. B1805 TaxID=2058892 RepID=UPI000CE4EB18|nr:hypothetical protein [Arthrobacter sp. B1805]
MAAVILAWNPDESQWTGTYPADMQTVRKAGVLRRAWTIPSPAALDPGMDVWFLVVGRQQAMRGLIGHGTLAGISGRTATGKVRLDIDVDVLLAHGDQVGMYLVAERIPELATTEFDALVVSGSAETALRALWAEANAPEAASVFPVPGALPASAVTRIAVNSFEHDGDLRRVALAHRGSACHACGLDFEQVYGVAAADLVQVHLITPLAHIDETYSPDALVDLIPLCPSCHVVVHSRWPDPYSVEEVRALLRRSGFLRGTVLSDEQLEAEAAAARMLGA